MGWTRRSAAVSVLLVMEEHRREAGVRLTQLRETRGWTQFDLAHEAGVSIKTISRFENGKHDGRATTVRALAKALKVDQGEIMGSPPPALGLGAITQLDQIEAKLDQLLAHFGLSLSPDGEVDAAEEVARAVEGAVQKARTPQRKRVPKAPPKKKPGRAA